MGNCKVSAEKIDSATTTTTATTAPSNLDYNDTSCSTTGSRTSALFRSIFNMSAPLTHRLVSKILLDKFTILRNEKPIDQKFTRDQPVESLPIHPINLDFEDIVVVDEECIEREKKQYSEFNWPGREDPNLRFNEDMIVIDIINFKCCIRLIENFEISVPMPDLPFGVTGQIEIGSNHESIQEAFLQFKIPKLRVWYIHGEIKTAYVAFWGRPNLIPHLSINADFGRGDICSGNFTEEGSLDDIVEKVLSSFGPKEMFERNTAADSGETSGIGNRIGKAIVKILTRFVPDVGSGAPLAVNLGETIDPIFDSLLGEPKIIKEERVRSVSEIKADMKLLEIELNEIEKMCKKEAHNTPVVNEDEDKDKESGGFFDKLCG